jgi:hypothetical protein
VKSIQVPGDTPYGIFKVVKDVGAFQRGIWGAKVADALDASDNDIVIDNKSTTCAFETTNLEMSLKEHGITKSSSVKSPTQWSQLRVQGLRPVTWVTIEDVNPGA